VACGTIPTVADPQAKMTPEERYAWREQQPTALYRLYDEDGVLLYAGITYDVPARWRHHRRHKAWWPQVARKQLVWFSTRREAEEAEIHAIVAGNPLHNVIKNWASYKATYRVDWLHQRLKEHRLALRTPRKPRAKAKIAAYEQLEHQLRVLEDHTPRYSGYWSRWSGCGLWPAQAIVLATRYENGECPTCSVQVPCPVVKAMGEPYRDHPFYCL